jgi:hypothetical protein
LITSPLPISSRITGAWKGSAGKEITLTQVGGLFQFYYVLRPLKQITFILETSFTNPQIQNLAEFGDGKISTSSENLTCHKFISIFAQLHVFLSDFKSPIALGCLCRAQNMGADLRSHSTGSALSPEGHDGKLNQKRKKSVPCWR